MSKSTLKKVLFVMLFAALLTCCLILGIAAAPADDVAAVNDGYVARTGEAGTDTYYKTLAEAISAVPENGTVTMIADTALNGTLTLTKSVTFAGTGTISTSAASTHTILLGAAVHLKVTDNVAISATGSNSSAIKQTGAYNSTITLSGNAKVTSKYWTINYMDNTGTTAKVAVNISENAYIEGRYGITINKKFLLTLDMTGGTIKTIENSGCAAVYIDSTDTSSAESVLNVSDGTIDGSANSCRAITLIGGAATATSINISGGTLKGNNAINIGGSAIAKVKVTGGTITGSVNGIYTSSKKSCTIDLLGGTITGTGTDCAGVWMNPVGNTSYTDTVLTIDGATLAGTLYAVSCQGYQNNTATLAYMTVIIKQSSAAKPTILKATKEENILARTVRMVDGSYVDLQISGGTISSPKGDCLIYASNAKGYTKLTLSGGYFAATSNNTHLLLNYGRGTFDVILSGSFGTGDGQTGSFGTPKTSVFCQAKADSTTNITSTASITSSTIIFRSQSGTLNLTINSGVITCTTNISYTTYANDLLGTSNIKIYGGELTTNNQTNMFDARAGFMNIYVYGGYIHDGKYLFSYRDFASDTTYKYYAQGETVIDMSSGSISSPCSIFVAWKSSDANLKVIKGDITCTCSAETKEMYMFARWDKPADGGGSATSKIEILGGNFSFTNKGKSLYTAVIGVKGTSSADVTISGGYLDGGNYGVRAQAGARLDLTMTGGTLTCCYAKNGNTAQGGSVIYSAAKITNITLTGGTLKGTGSGAAGVNIKPGVTANVTVRGTTAIDTVGYTFACWDDCKGTQITLNIYNGVFTTQIGMVFIGTGVGEPTEVGGAEVGASTVNIYGGIAILPMTDGDDVIRNRSAKTTVNLVGLTAFGGRALFTNKGLGTPTSAPGASLSNTYSVGAPMMDDGAGVRLVAGSNGLRFISRIDGETVAALTELADEGTVSYGTLIFPASYLAGLTSYTHSTISQYLDIAAVNGLIPDDNGGYTIRAAIVNILPQNYDREFVAIAYVKYEVGGITCYRYSALQQLETSRSMKQVARLALLDTSETQNSTYIYANTVGTGYSRYSSEQQAVLNSYGPDLTVKTIDIYMITGQSNGSGYSHFSTEFTSDNAKYAQGFSNVLYSGYACSATGSNYPYRFGTLTPVPTKAGLGKTEAYIGAELGLAEALSAYYNETTGQTAAIIKYADGGTYLSDNVTGSSARQGNWTSPTYLATHGKTDEVLSGNLYRNFISLVKATVAYYEVLGYEVNLCGVFWMQGCSERNYYNGIPALGNEAAVTSPTTEQVNSLYTTLFQTLVADMRSDLGKIIGEDLSTMPVVAGSISEAFANIQSKNQTNFVNMQAQMVSEESHTYLLSETRYLATGTDSGDSAHYSVDDMVFAGQKLGETFLALGGRGAHIKEPAEADYVAKVYDGSNYSYYTDLAYAINTAPSGSTVSLLKDVTLYGPLNVATFSTEVTFDGNGHTVNSYSIGHAMKVVGASTNITFNNLRLIHHRDGVDDADAIYMYQGATLNLTGENTYIEAYRCGIVIDKVSAVNISGGTFTTRNGSNINSAAVYVGSASTVNVTGGTFTGVNEGAAFHINNGKATVTISGGTFTPGKSATYAINNASADATLTVTDGASVSKGTKGCVYNAGSGTATY